MDRRIGFLLLICFAFAGVRLFGTFPPIDMTAATIFKDLAHVFIGGLLGGAIVATGITRFVLGLEEWEQIARLSGYDRQIIAHIVECVTDFTATLRNWLWLLTVGLIVVECAAFALSLFR